MTSSLSRSDDSRNQVKDKSTSSNDFQALILDCDGVMVDSEPLSCGAWNVVFYNEFNIDVGTDYSQILGKNGPDAATYYLEKHGLPVSQELVKRLVQRKEETYFRIAKERLKPMPGIRHVIQQARTRKWVVGVASSGTRKKIEFNLREAGLYDLVDIIVGAEGSVRGKPFPDVFLEAANKLRVEPSRCVVIEDTPSGISAAKRAKMFVIALVGTLDAHDLHEADMVVHNLSEINFDEIIPDKLRKKQQLD